jgi:predicted phage-related endonuclease
MKKSDILKECQNGIDGADISPIMGVNKNKSEYDVYLEKIDFIDRTAKYAGVLEKLNEANYWDLTFDEMIA